MKIGIKILNSFFNDSMWSILALVLMNVVAQFIVYPFWARVYGDEVYGNIVYIMSVINIFAISIGTAVNYTRMVDSATQETYNGNYNVLLCVLAPVASLLSVGISYYTVVSLSVIECLLIGLLCLCTTIRFYADVEFRMALNYKGYFKYYAFISLGYLLGIVLFYISRQWVLVLLPGEIMGLLYVWKKGTLFTVQPFALNGDITPIIQTVATLIASNILSNVIFNGDRLLLQNIVSGSAVTIYYLASLVGKTMTLITTPLNSVMIGYLVKYKESFSVKHVFLLIIATGILIVIGTIGSIIGSHVLIAILYPDNYHQVKEYFLIANLAQIVYFITGLLTTFLLRFSAKSNLIINIFYAICFALCCIIATLHYGIWGFCYSLLLVNVLRYLLAAGMCFWFVKHLQIYG